VIIVNKNIEAQQIVPVVVNSNGGVKTDIANKNNALLSIEWSIGELTSIETSKTDKYYLSTGVIQSNDAIYNNSSVGYLSASDVAVWPTPAKSYTSLKINYSFSGTASVKLINPYGIEIGKIDSHSNGSVITQSWDLSGCMSGVYYFSIDILNNNNKLIMKAAKKIIVLK